MNSILTSVKKMLGIVEDNVDFDDEIILHINSVFPTLNQLGIGPANGFMIEDDTATWDQFLGNNLLLNDAKTFVFLRVKLLFDPAQTSYLIDALNKRADEIAWRMNVVREGTEWVNPNPLSLTGGDLIFDGGSS